jgi:hypothetical protein
MDNKEKPLTLQDQLDAIEKILNNNFQDLLNESLEDRLTSEEIEAAIQSVFEYASQQTEALQAEIDARRMQVTCLEDDNEALKNEVERLKEENKRMNTFNTGQVLAREELKGTVKTFRELNETLSEDLRGKNGRITQLEEALRECIMYCHDDTAIERFKKALSQNNQLEKI